MNSAIHISERVTHATAEQMVTSGVPIHRLLETVMPEQLSTLDHHVVTSGKGEGKEVYVNDAGMPVVADEGSSSGSFVRHENGRGCGRVSSTKIRRLVGANQTEAPGARKGAAGTVGGGDRSDLCRGGDGQAGRGRIQNPRLNRYADPADCSLLLSERA